jgi:L-alanine-DL-glutamate epimerase-like enolase superfamily enzyme
MKIACYPLRLPLEHRFSISRGSIDAQRTLVVELEHDGLCGYGEASENRFYGNTVASMQRSLQRVAGLLDRYIGQPPQAVWPELHRLIGDDRFALSALDIAAHDWSARRRAVATWQHWGLNWSDVPPSSYTIGIDTVDRMVAKLQERSDWPIFKIKLGTDDDLAIVRELRRHTDALFRVDANCGWTAAQTIELSAQLAELGVEFIEQPLPPDASDQDKHRVFRDSALPIIADEDCQTREDVVRCAGHFHGVNVKVNKCGGLTPALQMLREARALGLKTMVGCMVESAVGISAAAQLLPLLDYADLDGSTLLADQPVTGVVVRRGNVQLPPRHGCGGELLRDRLAEFLLAEDP